jgi:chaperonin cofactor prefoldin
MEIQSLINIAAATVLSVLGWFARQLWDAVQSLKEDVKKLEVELPTFYSRKEEIQEQLSEFKTLLYRIYDKLDSKVDK